MRGAAGHVVRALLLTSLVACSGSPASDVDRADMRDDVRTTTQDVVAMLGEADLEPLRASGSYSVCGESGYEYGAGALMRPAGELATAVDGAERILTEDGWEVDSSERGEIPFVITTRGPLRVSVKASQIERGDVVVEVVHDCVDGERDDTPSFDSEPIDLG